MVTGRAKATIGVGLLALAIALAVPAIGTAQECIPSCDAADGRFLAITDGTGLDTLTDTTLDLTVRVNVGEADFMIGFHDGETGGLWDLAGPLGSPDPPAPAQTYTIFADPEADGTCGGDGCDADDEVIVLDGEAMADNDWSDFVIANVPGALNGAGTTYAYLVRATLGGDLDPAPVRNSFKVRTGSILEEDVTIEVFEQPFAFNASMPGFAELGIIYPGCVGVTLPVCLASLENTTYDGSFSFFVEQIQPQCEFIVWDGDLDHGNYDETDPDDDDPNVPAGLAGLPPWACMDPLQPCDAVLNPPLVGINFEDVALGLCVGGTNDGQECISDPPGPQPFVANCPGGTCGVTGNPPDNFNPTFGGGFSEIFVRGDALTYEVWSPDCPSGQVGCDPIGVNSNPSGNQEWEFFRLAVPGGGCYLDANGLPPDVDVPVLPAGVYEVKVLDLDLENLNAFRFAGRAIPEQCGPCVGAVTELTLEYNGTLEPIIRVELAGGGGVLFDESVPPNGRLTVQGSEPDGSFGAPLEVYVDGQLEATILTACDGEIFPGQLFGDLEIIEARSTEGGLICDDLTCLPDVGFETDGVGAPLVAGQIIDTEFAGFGMTVTTNDPVNHPAMVFDSSNPTGGDFDLGSPNQTCGGPGVGSGGEAGQAGENCNALGNLLIISEDGDSSDPDDNAGGGTLIFTFTSGVQVDEVEILDIDESPGGTVTAFDAGGGVIVAVPIQTLGNNSFQTVVVGATGVERLEVFFAGSGALAAINFCVDPVDPPVCSDTVVRDNFDTQSFGNNDGPSSWAGNWIEDDVAGAGPGSGNVKVTSSALRLGDYPNTGTDPSAARQVDLSGKESATLKFMFDTSSGVDSNDAITVEASADGGASWTTLEVITGLVGQNWGEREIDITGFISAQTQVRFRVSNLYGGSNEYFFVTHVEICGLCEPPPDPVCEESVVRDDFDSQSFSNNDGPDDWAGSWIEDDVAGAGPGSGNVKVTSSALRLGDYPNTGTHPSAARQVDLSGKESATLKFMFDTSSGVDSNDAITVEASADGGASWTTLEVITGLVGQNWGEREIDITGFISAQTQVRFRVSNLYGGSNEYFFVTHVEICGLCEAPPVCEPVGVMDNFDSESFNGSDGPDDWSGPWDEFDVAGVGPTSGNVKVWGGYLWVRGKSSTNTEPFAARSVDLSGTQNATVSFDWWTTSGVDTSDSVVIEVSDDGGSTYTVLDTFTGISGAHDGWESYDITPFISAQTTIRFRVNGYYGGSNEWFKVGFVSIDGSCEPGGDGGQGCTPGYWKQSQHFDSWVGFSPNDDFEAIFGVNASFSETLSGAMSLGGGDEDALARHAVAALLNASTPLVSYFESVAGVIALVQNAYATGDFEGTKNELDFENNEGCPLN